MIREGTEVTPVEYPEGPRFNWAGRSEVGSQEKETDDSLICGLDDWWIRDWGLGEGTEDRCRRSGVGGQESGRRIRRTKGWMDEHESSNDRIIELSKYGVDDWDAWGSK